MSATNRGIDRAVNDCYVTPPSLAEAIVLKLKEKSLIRPVTSLDMCEPSAGVGTFVQALKKHVSGPLTAVELNGDFAKRLKRSGADKVVVSDWLEHEGKYDLIVGNPPFLEAEYHVRHAHRLLKPQGVLAYLLRLNFFGSSERTEFWEKYRPAWLFPITPRPHYLTSDMTPVLNKHGKKGTDATEYAVFVWRKANLGVYDKKHVVSQIGEHVTWHKEKAKRKSKDEAKSPVFVLR